MDFEEFLTELDELSFGLVASNTYLNRKSDNPKPDNCIYIMVAGRGNKGKYYKDEGKVENLSTIFIRILSSIKQDIGR